MPDYRNATASWSWYLHQWKVGVFVALKKISELIDWKSDETEINSILEKWRIIYENAEDFDIQENVEDEDENWNLQKWRVDSRHQVKAYKDWNNLKDYESVLEETKYRSDWERECGFDISNCKNSKKFLHTIEEVKWFWLSEAEYNIEKQEWNIHNLAKYVPNPNEIELYTYPEWFKYCDITSTDDLLKQWSDNIINTIKWHGTNSEYIYESILYILDEKIRHEHTNDNESVWYPKLYLSKIYEAINSFTTFEDLDEMRLRESFVRYYEYYKMDLSSPYSIANLSVLDEYMEFVSSLKKNHFYSYLKEMHFYNDFFSDWWNFNSIWFWSVICDYIYDFEWLTKLDDFNNYLDWKKYKLSCCNEEDRRKIWVVRWLIENIFNWNLNVKLFMWKKILNRNIDLDIEKFHSIKNWLINDNWWKKVSMNKSVWELKWTSLISKNTILDINN